jgi:hypothetical protein
MVDDFMLMTGKCQGLKFQDVFCHFEPELDEENLSFKDGFEIENPEEEYKHGLVDELYACYDKLPKDGYFNHREIEVDEDFITQSPKIASIKFKAVRRVKYDELFKRENSMSTVASRSPSLCKNRPLCLRNDVMNKNFIRAVRRELKSIFTNFIEKNKLSKGFGKRVFRSNLNRFA